MKNITLKQKRFLIVWISINAFALFVNIAHLEGRIKKGGSYYNSSDNDVHKDYTICLFMDNNKSIEKNQTFYPFTTDFKSIVYYQMHINDPSKNYMSFVDEGFLGVFNGYGVLEFIVYMILGFAIVFIPKMWNNK